MKFKVTVRVLGERFPWITFFSPGIGYMSPIFVDGYIFVDFRFGYMSNIASKSQSLYWLFLNYIK